MIIHALEAATTDGRMPNRTRCGRLAGECWIAADSLLVGLGDDACTECQASIEGLRPKR